MVPEGWTRATVDDLSSLRGGHGFPLADQGYTPGGVPFIKVSDLNLPENDRVIGTWNNAVPEQLAGERGWKTHPPGATVFPKVGAALLANKRRRLSRPTIIDNNMMSAAPRTGIDSLFLFYLFQTIDFQEYVRSGAVPSVNQRVVGEIEVFHPPLPEQREIGAILCSVDDVITATRKVVEQTKRVKQGLLQILVTRGIGHTRFKKVPADWVTGRLPGLEEMPYEWEITRLTNVARLESGHTPARDRADYWNGGVPWVSLHDTDRLKRRMIDDTAMTVTEAGLENSSARLLPEGTVVLSRTATIGRCSVLGRPMATSQDFANYVCGPKVHNAFLCHLFRAMAGVWKSLCAGSTHQTVYMPDFRKLTIALPPLHEQLEIAARIDAVDDVLESWPRYQQSMTQLKEGLLHDLLTGRVRVRLD